MFLLCALGIHRWNHCRCRRNCGAKRVHRHLYKEVKATLMFRINDQRAYYWVDLCCEVCGNPTSYTVEHPLAAITAAPTIAPTKVRSHV